MIKCTSGVMCRKVLETKCLFRFLQFSCTEARWTISSEHIDCQSQFESLRKTVLSTCFLEILSNSLFFQIEIETQSQENLPQKRALIASQMECHRISLTRLDVPISNDHAPSWQCVPRPSGTLKRQVHTQHLMQVDAYNCKTSAVDIG